MSNFHCWTTILIGISPAAVQIVSEYALMHIKTINIGEV
jgi:hypothetical protein